MEACLLCDTPCMHGAGLTGGVPAQAWSTPWRKWISTRTSLSCCRTSLHRPGYATHASVMVFHALYGFSQSVCIVISVTHIPAPPWVRHSCICDGNACIVWSFTVCVHGYFCHAFWVGQSCIVCIYTSCAGMHCIGDSYIVLYIRLPFVCIAISVSHHSATACIVSMLLVVSMSNFIGMVGYATHHSATAVHTVHSLCEGCWMVWLYRCYRL
jgi:hypothetical protein